MKKTGVFVCLLCLVLMLLAVFAAAETTLADGVYYVDAVLLGGSGKASVQSPAEITVFGGKCTAKVVMSSPHYDYMEVEGVRYLPVNKEGNSTFLIPVTLDEDIPVSAETLAMSQPHVIDYTLRFDGATARSLSDPARPSVGMWIAVVAVLAVVFVFRFARLRKNNA
ncbi:MAG: hypothetical protein IJS55_00045 [Oscillospiraceae bacterium]|nr:hypothetical protein [Oscillospiraceae bacterium]